MYSLFEVWKPTEKERNVLRPFIASRSLNKLRFAFHYFSLEGRDVSYHLHLICHVQGLLLIYDGQICIHWFSCYVQKTAKGAENTERRKLRESRERRIREAKLRHLVFPRLQNSSFLVFFLSEVT
jgi:hypothetical protein